jgi:hypothetical protein
MMLKTNLNLSNADAIYAALIAAHEGLSEEESHAMNARLILLLMNHIGEEAVLRAALERARNPKA